MNPEAHQDEHGGQVLGDVDQRDAQIEAFKQRQQSEHQHQRHERRRDDHAGDDQPPWPVADISPRGQRPQPALDVVREA